MAKRGRVVIDLSEDSPPPPEPESQRAQSNKIPDSRFITPSDDDDSDGSIEVLWDTRKKRHDTSASNTLKSNQPADVHDLKKHVSKPAPTEPNISRPLGPFPNTQKPEPSSFVPPPSSWMPPPLQQQPRPQSQPRPAPAPQNQTHPRPRPAAESHPRPRPAAESQAQPRPATESQAQPQRQPQPRPVAPSESRESSVSITNPSTKQWLASLSKFRAAPSASTPQQLTLPPGATPPSSTPDIPPARSQFPQPPRPSSAHAGLDSRLHAASPGLSAGSMGTAPSQPLRLAQPVRPLQPSPAPATTPVAHHAVPSNPTPRAPSNSTPRASLNPPSRLLPGRFSEGRNVTNSVEHARNTSSQPSGPRTATTAFSSKQSVPKPNRSLLAPTSFPSELHQPRKRPETRPMIPKLSTSSTKQPPVSSQKNLPSPTRQHKMHLSKTTSTNVVDLDSPSSDDSFVTAAGNPSSIANIPAHKTSPRIGKRKMEVIEVDDEEEEPLKRLRRTRSSAVRPKSQQPPIEPNSVIGSVQVDTHDHPTFPTDISKIKPFKNRFGQPFTLEEDALIKHLKEVKKISWKEFEHFFPGRKWSSMQTRYSKVLSKMTVRPSGSIPLSRPASTREILPRELPRPTRDLRRHAHADSVGSSMTRQDEADDVADDPHSCRRTAQPLTYLMRHRELGATRGREWPRKFHAGVKDLVFSSMGAQAYIDNASGDVSTIAWSPDGKCFAAGAVAVTDRHSVDYNKTRNLVVGSAATQSAQELPQHVIKHMLPDGRQKDLFATVQLVAWSPDSKHMYSVGIDQRLHRFNVNESPLDATLVHTVEHPASVDFLSVSNNGLVATGCASADPGAIRVLAYDDENTSLRAVRLSGTVQSKKTPSALKWGTAHNHQNYLLAGFSREAEVLYAEDDNRDKEGEVALWDINTQQRLETDAPNKNVFDLAWNPNPTSSSSIFAVASRTFGHVGHGINSVVRLYSPRQNRAQHTMELDCPAWDVNDVVYSPHDSNLVAVGSTEGRVYIWDVRYTKHGQSPLSTLKHEESIEIPHPEKKRWEADTGIRFLSWGSERNRLYSGSSDGVVKCWDPYRHDSDKNVGDVVRLNSAIMSGAFSPDFSHLLIGEVAARLNLLSVGNDGSKFDSRTTPRFKVEERPLQEEPAHTPLNCQEMLDTKALEIKPAGTMPFKQVVQGPNYDGPYRKDSEVVKLREDARKFQEKVLRSLRRRNKQTRKSGYQETQACSLDCGFIPLPDDYDAPRIWPSEGIPDRMWDWIRAKGPTGEFSCFRCGKAATITSRARTVECSSCSTAWRTGALGYEVIEQGRTGVSDFRSKEEETESADDLCDSEDERERFREVSIESDSDIVGS